MYLSPTVFHVFHIRAGYLYMRALLLFDIRFDLSHCRQVLSETAADALFHSVLLSWGLLTNRLNHQVLLNAELYSLEAEGTA